MNKNSYQKTLLLAVITGVVMLGVCFASLAWTPVVYFTNDTVGDLSNVTITLTTAEGSETVRYDAVAPGQTITIRRNTSDLRIGSFKSESIHGTINVPVAEDIAATEKVRIGISSDRSYSRTKTRFW